MKALKNSIEQIEKTVIGIGKYSSLLILVLIFVTVFDVVTRKFQFLQQALSETFIGEFFSPTKLQELEWHLHAAIFLLAFGFAYLSAAHVRVDILRHRFTNRKLAVFELCGIIFLALPYLATLCYFGWDFVITSYYQNETSASMTGLAHRWLIKSVFLVGVSLLLIACITTSIRIISLLLTQNNVQDEFESIEALSLNTEVVSSDAPLPLNNSLSHKL